MGNLGDSRRAEEEEEPTVENQCTNCNLHHVQRAPSDVDIVVASCRCVDGAQKKYKLLGAN